MLSNENNCDETPLIYRLTADVPRQYVRQLAAVVVRWNYKDFDDRGSRLAMTVAQIAATGVPCFALTFCMIAASGVPRSRARE